MGCFNTVTNQMGVPYLSSTNTNVGTTSVDLALGSRRRPLPPGYFTVRISDVIPTGTTATLPVTLTRNGITRPLTLFDGTAVTAGDLIGSNGVLTVFNDSENGILQLVSPIV